MEYLIHKGEKIPLIGFGTYGLGLNDNIFESEEITIRKGIDLYDMTLLDTAESYGDGISESFISNIIKYYDRDKLFIVDKILPENARQGKYLSCCKNSLKRLGVDYIDLYLLHWREGLELQGIVNGLEQLVRKGLIKYWGVSNFDTKDMIELFECKNGNNCFCNQILYNIQTRGPEYDLIPWCNEHNVLIMAYSPLCHFETDRLKVVNNSVIIDIANRENKTPESLMLSFVIRNNDIITIFKTSNLERLKNNMKNVFAPIVEKDYSILSETFKAPNCKVKLETI